MTNRGVSAANLPQVIFSLGTAPLYEPKQVLLDQGHYANREVTGDATSYLEETNGGAFAVGPVPVHPEAHKLKAGFDHLIGADVALDHVRDKDITESRVFPARHYDWNIFFAGSQHPGIFRVYLIVLFDLA